MIVTVAVRHCRRWIKRDPSYSEVRFSRAASRSLLDRWRERFVQPLPLYGDLDPGAFLLQEHHDARVTSTPVSYTHLTLPTTPYV